MRSSERIPLHDHSNFNSGGLIDSVVQQVISAVGTDTGASVTPSDTVTDETTLAITATAGVASTYSRGDHTHGSPTGASIGALGFVGPLLIADVHSTPIVFGDVILNEATDDFLYADV